MIPTSPSVAFVAAKSSSLFPTYTITRAFESVPLQSFACVYALTGPPTWQPQGFAWEQATPPTVWGDSAFASAQCINGGHTRIGKSTQTASRNIVFTASYRIVCALVRAKFRIGWLWRFVFLLLKGFVRFAFWILRLWTWASGFARSVFGVSSGGSLDSGRWRRHSLDSWMARRCCWRHWPLQKINNSQA